MKSMQAIGGEVNHQQCPSSISEFEKKIQYIQQVFEYAWRDYPAESKISQSCYVFSNEGAISSSNTQVESLLGNFQRKIYKSADEIQIHFFELRNFWFKQVATHGIKNKNFINSYRICLRLMEALFICAFMDNLSDEIEAISVPEPNATVEIKQNIESIAAKVIHDYKLGLAERLFAGKKTEFINLMLQEVVTFNRKIVKYNDNIAKILAPNSLADDDKSVAPSTSKVHALFKEEVAFTLLPDRIAQLNAQQQGLIKAREELLNKNYANIDRFLSEIRSVVIPVDIDVDAIPEFAPIVLALKQLKDSIESIKYLDTLKELELGAEICLKESIDVNKEFKFTLAENLTAFSNNTGFFGKDKKAVEHLVVMYKSVFDYLNTSKHIAKCQDERLLIANDDSKWIVAQTKLIQYLESLKNQLIERVNRESFVEIRETILAHEREELIGYSSPRDPIKAMPLCFLESRRKELDEQWKELLAKEDNVMELQAIFSRLNNKANNVPPDMQDVLKRTQERLRYKLTAWQLFQSIIPPDIIEEFEREDKPDLNPGLSENNLSQGKSHSSFMKVALGTMCAGLMLSVGVGLITAGVSLFFELSLAVILAASFGGFTLTGMMFGAACLFVPHNQSKLTPLSHVARSPTIEKEHARKVSIKNMLPLIPPMMPVFPPNSLNEEESTSCFSKLFSCCKKDSTVEDRVDSHLQHNPFLKKGGSIQ